MACEYQRATGPLAHEVIQQAASLRFAIVLFCTKASGIARLPCAHFGSTVPRDGSHRNFTLGRGCFEDLCSSMLFGALLDEYNVHVEGLAAAQ